MDTQTFINQVAAGDAASAKDLLNDLLKIEMAQSLFTGKEESSEPEVQNTEETAAEE